MPHAVTGWFCEKEVSAVLLFVSPAARASAPSRHSDRWTQGACRRTGATGWFCKKKVSAVLLFCFSPVRKKLLGFVQECFRHTLRKFGMVYRAEHGLLPLAERAAAESDVARLPSEATATFGVGWLTPPLQHSDMNESSPARPATL